MKYDGDNGPVYLWFCFGSSYGEQNGLIQLCLWMEAVDSWIELPKEDVDKDFLMPVEDGVYY